MVRLQGSIGALFALVGFQPVQGSADLRQEFERFVRDFGKVYADAEEAEARFLTFVNNLAFIAAENAKGHSYTLGITQFADMTTEEFARTHTGILKNKPQWEGMPHLGSHKVSNLTLPSSVDWRSQGAVTPVKNQGQCGSCWSFSSTGALEGAWKIATGQLVSLSEQQFVDCTTGYGNHGCGGGIMENSFRFAQTTGICSEDSYPYQAAQGYCSSSCSVALPQGSVVGYRDVPQGDTQALMDAVAQQPVSVILDASSQAFQLYRAGIVLDAGCGQSPDHAVLAVGYGTTPEGQDYWLVKNSWGTGWGDGGYVMIGRGDYGVGACGIKTQPSYPVVQGAGPSPSPSPSPSPWPPAPSPSPVPPPPPSPSAGHYNRPPCQADETPVAVPNFSGTACAPNCDGTDASCPQDMPAAAGAQPRCMLQNPTTGQHYCGLACTQIAECPEGSVCVALTQYSGFCVYPGAVQAAQASVQVAQGAAAINV